MNFDKKIFSNPKDVYKYLKYLRNKRKEYVYGLYLNTRNSLVHEEIISIGNIESSIIHPREVFYPAIKNTAYSLILVHNHPSGDCSPSKSDEYITKNIAKCSEILRIPFLDHIIVSKNGYYSFRERGAISRK